MQHELWCDGRVSIAYRFSIEFFCAVVQITVAGNSIVPRLKPLLSEPLFYFRSYAGRRGRTMHVRQVLSKVPEKEKTPGPPVWGLFVVPSSSSCKN